MSKIVKIMNGKVSAKFKELILSKKKKGALNAIEILLIIAVLLLVTYPAYKTLVSGLLTSVQTWFTTTTGNIFK